MIARIALWQQSLNRSIVFTLLIVSASLLLAGCASSPIFQGVSTVEAAQNELLVLPAPEGLETPQRAFANPTFREAREPVAPLSSFAFVPRLLPTNSRTVLMGSYSPYVQTPAGPAFAWADTENFLVLGTDRRGSEGNWRTDTIMVVGLDRQQSRAAVLSIPRDLYVQIPGFGWGRINQVDYLGEKVLGGDGGGPALLADVVNTTLGVRVDHWACVDMSGFQSLVDAVGGVTIHLDCPFYEPIYNLSTEQWEFFTLPPGDVTMDGETAYWFVRLRLRESDIGRSQRQRQFLWALRDRVSQTNLIVRFPELWRVYREIFSTDLSMLQMIDYARMGMSFDSSNVRATGISISDLNLTMTDGGASVLRIGDPARGRGGQRRMGRAGNGGRLPAGLGILLTRAARCAGTAWVANGMGTEAGPGAERSCGRIHSH